MTQEEPAKDAPPEVDAILKMFTQKGIAALAVLEIRKIRKLLEEKL